MASLHPRSDGYQVRFGKRHRGKDLRKTIRLGHIGKRAAETAKLHIETLYQCKLLEAAPGGRTRAWLDSLPAEILNRIADKGLCAHRHDEVHTIDNVCQKFIEWKRNLGRKPASIVVYENAVRMLVHYFGADRDIASIAPGEIDDMVAWAYVSGGQNDDGDYTEPLAATTHSRRFQNIKSIFNRAARMKWLPMADFYQLFDSLPKQVRTNRKRRAMTPESAVYAAMKHALNNEQRLIFALARWAGIRMPSELIRITWQDVDRESEKLLIRAPKQEHNEESKHERKIPIWPEIRPYLDIAEKEFIDRSYRRYPDEPLDMSQPVISRYRSTNTSSHRQMFLRACYRAGLTSHANESPWPKLWLNMRSTRVTELRQKYPKWPDAVNYWMNHSEQISQQHYQQWDEFEWRAG